MAGSKGGDRADASGNGLLVHFRVVTGHRARRRKSNDLQTPYLHKPHTLLCICSRGMEDVNVRVLVYRPGAG